MVKKKDENEAAFATLQELLRRDAERDGLPQVPIPELEKVSYRVEAGRKGGIASGKTRKAQVDDLSKKKRAKIARKAARARWESTD
jgi:hypothetical protein